MMTRRRLMLDALVLSAVGGIVAAGAAIGTYQLATKYGPLLFLAESPGGMCPASRPTFVADYTRADGVAVRAHCRRRPNL